MEQKLRFAELQDKKKLTNAFIAKELDVSRELISYYRSGKRTPPIKSITKLVEVLGINFIEIFEAPPGYFHYYDDKTGEWGGIWKKNTD